MMSDHFRTTEAPSEVYYDYVAVRMTRSRLQKGLVAIPRSVLHLFPAGDATINVYLGDADRPQAKKYTHYAGATRESRIGGMVRWFEDEGIRDGDELVIQLLDRKKFLYRLSTRQDFIKAVKRHQRGLELARTEDEARSHVAGLKRWIKSEDTTVALSEYRRLAMQPYAGYRGMVARVIHGARESAPPHLRMLLGEIYGGHCQVCDFTFLKRDGTPYFEIHHLFPTKGHHPKNLVVSCANCHRQFEYARTRLQIGAEDWLVAVSFNSVRRDVNQAVLGAKLRPAVRRVFAE